MVTHKVEDTVRLQDTVAGRYLEDHLSSKEEGPTAILSRQSAAALDRVGRNRGISPSRFWAAKVGVSEAREPWTGWSRYLTVPQWLPTRMLHELQHSQKDSLPLRPQSPTEQLRTAVDMSGAPSPRSCYMRYQASSIQPTWRKIHNLKLLLLLLLLQLLLLLLLRRRLRRRQSACLWDFATDITS